MKTKPSSAKNPSIVRYTRNTFAQELMAWVMLLRSEWKWALVIVVGMFFLLVFTKPLPPRDVHLAVGQEGSKFELIGKKFIPYLADQGISLHLIHTKGSAANIATLADPKSSVDAALAVGGVASKGQYPQLQSLGSIEYIPLWIFYRGKEIQGSGAYQFFSTKRVAIGNIGSASATVLEKLLALTGITLEKQPNFLQIPDKEAIEKLLAGEIDAICIMDSINAPNVQTLLKAKNLNILNFPLAPAYVKKLPFFSAVVLPMGGLDLKAARPSQDIKLLASSGVLLVDKAMHPAIQQAFLIAANEVAKSDEQFFATPEFFPAYIDYSIPESPTAKRFYDQGPPLFADRIPLWLINYLDRIWLLALGGFAVIYPLFKLFPSYRRLRSIMLIEEGYEKIQSIENLLLNSNGVYELEKLIDQLNQLDKESVGWSVASEEMNRLYTMKSALNLVKQQIYLQLQIVSKEG